MKNTNSVSNEITYSGELMHSNMKKPLQTSVAVSYAKHKVVISFVSNGELIDFTVRADQNGRLSVSEKVMDEYILSGFSSGFGEDQSSPVTIGKNRKTISFRIIIDYFTGQCDEIFFEGALPGTRVITKKRKSFFRTVAGMVW